MHPHHDIFVLALHERRKVRLTSTGAEDGKVRVRTCAPLDVGPLRRAADHTDRYHVWDFEGSKRPHATSVRPEQMIKVEATDELFDPGKFVTWDLRKTPWSLPRDWGIWS